MGRHSNLEYKPSRSQRPLRFPSLNLNPKQPNPSTAKPLYRTTHLKMVLLYVETLCAYASYVVQKIPYGLNENGIRGYFANSKVKIQKGPHIEAVPVFDF